MQVHIYDCLSRDERIIKETESEKEVEYLSAYDSDDGRTRKPKPYNDRKTHHMVIHLFGMDAKGQAMRIDVNGFRPFFYVAMPDNMHDYSLIEKHLRTKLRTDVELIEFKIENHQKFYGYTGGKSFRFLKMSFQSLSMFYTVRKEFLDDKQCPKMSIKGGKPLDVYESI